MIDNSNLRKRAKKRGLTMSVKSGAYTFLDAGTPVFTGPGDDAVTFLAAMAAPVGRPAKARVSTGPEDHRKARKFGYDLHTEGGVIRLLNAGDVVLETRDVTRLRLYFNNAEQRLVPWGPSAVAREIAAMRKVAEREARVEARRLAGLARKAERKSKRTYGVLDHDDPGLASEDHTPDEAGLVLTALELPAGINGEAALIALWAAENSNTAKAAPSVSAKIGTATAALAKKTAHVEVWLSGHDRASLARYGAPAGVVLAAAMMARRQSRSR
jgi:hypothetical protein